jgi:hypothetical protein
VAASKTDLPGRKVPPQEGKDWAAAQGFPYFEVWGSRCRGWPHRHKEGLNTRGRGWGMGALPIISRSDQ